ncbi:MAG TPA: peptidase [Ignavibacteriaceae bacterium]|nr:MAG: Peptidase family M49 [Ignavibacteria bacterium ADurb.Bin266]OQY71400.1 MAG: peptidase [Ignavibacteriales bacterium UTCHB2]HQF42519.1 peptidase [Ignavibacteriaceae bacterium]HQI40126.1 peptidase [Ignavibacteriaceae bacterium]
MKKILVTSFIILLMVACSENNKQKESEEVTMLKEKIAKFVPVEIQYDETLLTDREKIVLEKLYRASQIIDEIFLEQVYSKNDLIKSELTKSEDELSKLQLEYFNIMFGPFDRLEDNAPFIGTDKKPLGADFYPEDMTKDEFEKWINDNPNDEKSFTNEFTMIRREDGKLVAIPYSEYFKDKLTEASKYLKEAAEFADNPSLKKYLISRADAFLSNDYYQSDMDWMDLKDHSIEIVIGPYEVYEDEMFNYKASFESFVTIKDPVETKKLEVFAKYLNDIEKNLPLDEKHKNFSRGSESPIVVVNEVFTAGDSKAGVQTLAFNLPNDERVRQAKGSKKVMLKNVHEAKFEKLLQPIAEIVLEPEQLKYVTFNAFFNHTLMHEMSHGVGPGFIKLNGKNTEVKKELKETYSTIEECKADILGMYNNMFMIEKGVYPKESEDEILVTFLAGAFRSMRFGISEAHGGGNAIIYNYLLEKGAYVFDENTQKVKVDFEKIHPALKDLANLILTIQAEGNHQGAKDLIAKYAVNSPSIEMLRKKLNNLPVDIKPVYEIEEKLK